MNLIFHDISKVLSADRIGDEIGTNEGRNTKKVWFKEVGRDPSEFMMVDSSPMSRVSWQEKLLEGKGFESCNGVTNANLEIEYGNILRSSIDGIPAIDFSKKVKRGFG